MAEQAQYPDFFEFPRPAYKEYRMSAPLAERGQVLGIQIAEAIVQHFNVPPEEVCIMTALLESDTPASFVVHTGEGINVGEWQEIFNDRNKDNYLLDIEGFTYDTRCINFAMYQAMCENLIQAGDLGAAGRRYTWLTGELTDNRSRYAPVAIFDAKAKKPILAQQPKRDGDYGRVRFRPAVLF